MAEPTDPPEVTVRIPGLLSRFTDGQQTVSLRSATVAGSLDRLLEMYPALEPHVRDGQGELRHHLKLFHDGTEVSERDGADIALTAGDEIVVLQAVSGG